MLRLPIITPFIAAMALALPLAAQDAPLERLDTWGRNRGWEGVGILMVGGNSSCTGAMIATDIILTAAHCLFDHDGQLVMPRQIEFRAGWREGKSVARRYGKAAIVHRDYEGGGPLTSRQIRNDIALLQLADPILSTHADPFRPDSGIDVGQNVSVVSYGAGRNDTASRQRSCNVLEARDGVVAMSCDVVPGSSGSPVFSTTSGNPRIISVISALGKLNGRQVSFGMDIQRPLAELMKDFRAGIGVYPKSVTQARRIKVGGSDRIAGARFLKP
ncbi:MAG: trypsin-like peptidase domain-containing protein [Marinosulfonomonas sp.]|nr:trypsin-like peptidase domain-containing protein [Marinosulfonomonas sp.]